MDKIAIGISCFYGNFKAAGLRKHALLGTHEWAGGTEDFSYLSAALKEAVRKTKAEGRQVSMVITHPRLISQIIEVPPVKGWALDRFLQRRISGLKTFPEEPAWSSQGALPNKNSRTLQLHLLPKEIRDQLIQGCQEAQLNLVRLLPSTAILASQLRALALARDETVLLAAETGPVTTVVIGNGDGRIYLARLLRSGWGQAVDHFAVDLTRTIGFAEQQSGITVGSVWLFGENAPARLADVQNSLKLPVKLSPVPCTPFYWAEQAARLPARDDGNLISPELRQAHSRKRFLTATTLILGVLLLLSLASAAYFEFLRRSDLKNLHTVKTEIFRLTRQRQEFQAREAELKQKKELVHMVCQEQLPRVPPWFLGYLGQVLPDDLLLTDLRVARTNNQWSVSMTGVIQTTNPAPSVVLTQAFHSLSNQLVTGPFNLRLTRNLLVARANAAELAPGALGANAMAVPPAEPEEVRDTFIIEGVTP